MKRHVIWWAGQIILSRAKKSVDEAMNRGDVVTDLK